jgi:hypothetical protein
MKQNLWLTLVTCLANGVDQGLWKAIDYLKEEVRVIKEEQEKDKRILLNDQHRIRLAAKAKQLTRELSEQVTDRRPTASASGQDVVESPASSMAG